MTKPLQLAREALGTRQFKYTVAVSQRADGTFDMVVSSSGLQGAHRMPEPSPESRPFASDDLDELGEKAAAFLKEWRAAQPAAANQVTCCTRVVTNAITRARAKLALIAAGPQPRPVR